MTVVRAAKSAEDSRALEESFLSRIHEKSVKSQPKHSQVSPDSSQGRKVDRVQLGVVGEVPVNNT